MNVWKFVASKWRTLEETVKPLSIVEEKTLQATKLIKKKGLLQSSLDIIGSNKFGDDEDDDWP